MPLYIPVDLANTTPTLMMSVFETRDQPTWLRFAEAGKTISISKGSFDRVWLDLSYRNLNTTNLINWYAMEPSVREHKVGASALNACAVAKDTIQGFQALSENWDGYHAAAISEAVATNATAIMDLIQGSPVSLPIPEISPNPNGTIGLEWETPNGEAYIEIGNSRYGGYISARHLPPMDFEGEAACFDPIMFSSIYEYLFSPHTLQATISDIRMQEPQFARLAA